MNVRRILRLLAVAAAAGLGACATAPPEPLPPQPVAPPVMTTLPEAVCPVCTDHSFEIARLKQDLAAREAELKDLRSNTREQAKVVQESTREVTRAKAKLRRLATQADAASYLAEVEVALKAQRAVSPPEASPLLALAQARLDAAAAPFAQGDYVTAMDRAAQAEQLLAVVGDTQPPAAMRSRASPEVLLQVTIPLRSTVDTRLRRDPLPKAPVITIVKKDSPLVAHAYKGRWMRVETEEGRSGWIAQAELGAR
jgi:hypothetical protein